MIISPALVDEVRDALAALSGRDVIAVNLCGELQLHLRSTEAAWLHSQGAEWTVDEHQYGRYRHGRATVGGVVLTCCAAVAEDQDELAGGATT